MLTFDLASGVMMAAAAANPADNSDVESDQDEMEVEDALQVRVKLEAEDTLVMQY